MPISRYQSQSNSLWATAKTYAVSWVYNIQHIAFVQMPVFVRTLRHPTFKLFLLIIQHLSWILNALLYRGALTKLVGQLLAKYSVMVGTNICRHVCIYVCIYVCVYVCKFSESFAIKVSCIRKALIL